MLKIVAFSAAYKARVSHVRLGSPLKIKMFQFNLTIAIIYYSMYPTSVFLYIYMRVATNLISTAKMLNGTSVKSVKKRQN